TFMSPNDDFNFYNSITTLLDHWGNPLVAYYYAANGNFKLRVHGPVDSDTDLIPDNIEDQFGTDSNDVTSDADAVFDGSEILCLGTSPVTADSDADGTDDAADLDSFDGTPTNILPDGSCDRLSAARWDPLGTSPLYSKTSVTVTQGLRALSISNGG